MSIPIKQLNKKGEDFYPKTIAEAVYLNGTKLSDIDFVSDQNLKTINGDSLIGVGNILEEMATGDIDLIINTIFE